MTKSVKAMAEDLCAGRLVIAQEGGYSLDHLPYCNLALVEAGADLLVRSTPTPWSSTFRTVSGLRTGHSSTQS
jgi:acetoin utilization deacetylase AcuC-like enzyme